MRPLLLLPFVSLCLRASLASAEASTAEPLAPTIIELGEGDSKYKAALTPDGWVGERVWHGMSGFNEGLCPVQEKKDGKWGAIDMTGNLIVPLEFDLIHPCQSGFLCVKKSNAFGYLKADGSVAIAPSSDWEDAGLFNGAERAPIKKDGKWGYINPQGELVIPSVYQEARPFPPQTHLARVRREDKWGFIDPAGNEVIPCQYEAVGAFGDQGEPAWFQREKDGLLGLIDPTGKELIPPTWFAVKEFLDNRAAVQKEKNGLWGFIDSSGELVTPLLYDEVSGFSEGFASVYLLHNWVLIDTEGRVNDKIHADEVRSPSRGLAKIRSGQTFGLAGMDGSIVEPAQWQQVWHVKGSHTVVQQVSAFTRGWYAVRSPDGNLSPFYPAPVPETLAEAPDLRIEAGMHFDRIHAISTDRTGNWVLTASADGTGKLWKRENGTSTLIHTFRPSSKASIDDCALSPDGKLAALVSNGCAFFDTDTGQMVNRIDESGPIAFSPSGSMIAIGRTIYEVNTGRGLGELPRYCTTFSWPLEGQIWAADYNTLYRFDVSSLRSGSSLPNPISIEKSLELSGSLGVASIDLSPDHTRLAVAYNNSRTVTLHHAADLSLIKKLETTAGSESPISEVVWLSDGRLACAGRWDKIIDNRWTRAIRVWPEAVLRPGSTVKAQPLDLPGADNTIYDLCALPDGGLLFAAATPQWGVLEFSGANGQRTSMLGESPIAAFNGNHFRDEGFKISPDADTILFTYGSGKPYATFSVAGQKLTLLDAGASLPDNLLKPRRQSDQLKVEVKDERLKIAGNEVEYAEILSYAIDQENRWLIAGTRNGCRAYSPTGRELWDQQTAQHCWAVNLSRDGRIAVAAYSDGSIRWHDVENKGQELLAFFPHADQKRWVLWADTLQREKDWEPLKLPGNYASQGGQPGVKIIQTTPEMEVAGLREGDFVVKLDNKEIQDMTSLRTFLATYSANGSVEVGYHRGAETGTTLVQVKREFTWGDFKRNGAYFTCSADAEDLIGWHIDRGPDREADFYPAAQLYSLFYRPDIVLETLKQRRPAGEIAQELGLAFNLEAALKKVPVVTLQGIRDGETAGTDTILVGVEAIDTGGGLRDIALFHNGKRVPQEGPGQRRGERRTLAFTVALAPGDNEIKAQAANDNQTLSYPAIARVKFNGVQATSTLHLLTVGLNRYQNPRYNLTYCVPDSAATAAAFEKRAQGLFSNVKVHALTDDQVTKASLAAKFAELARAARPQDVFVFSYAGHGVLGDPPGKGEDPMFYLVPHDVTRLYGDPEMLAEKGVSRADLEQWCANIPARKQIMLLDTCQSGGLVDTFAMRGAAEEKAIAQLARATGTVVIASTGAEAFARESQEIGHGIFTKALLDGLADAKADSNGDGSITVKEIEAYINQAVPELSQKLVNTPQFPTSYARGQDFPIGVVK